MHIWDLLFLFLAEPGGATCCRWPYLQVRQANCVSFLRSDSSGQTAIISQFHIPGILSWSASGEELGSRDEDRMALRWSDESRRISAKDWQLTLSLVWPSLYELILAEVVCIWMLMPKAVAFIFWIFACLSLALLLIFYVYNADLLAAYAKCLEHI